MSTRTLAFDDKCEPVGGFMCDTCKIELATQETFDQFEVPSTDPEGWRMFEAGPAKRGCDRHPVENFAHYLDGRVIAIKHCVPEKVK